MIIYNVTVSVEDNIKKDWLDWMINIHIPEVMSCGIFTKAQINHVIVQGDSDNTFAISYTCSSMQKLHQYQLKFAPDLQKKYIKRFGEGALAFRTVMRVIKEF